MLTILATLKAVAMFASPSIQFPADLTTELKTCADSRKTDKPHFLTAAFTLSERQRSLNAVSEGAIAELKEFVGIHQNVVFQLPGVEGAQQYTSRFCARLF